MLSLEIVEKCFRTDGVRRRYAVVEKLATPNLADLRVVREVRELKAAHRRIMYRYEYI